MTTPALVEALREAGLAVFPCWVRQDAAAGKWRKGPAVPPGEDWRLTAYRPPHDPQLNWSSGVVGVPIPPRILVLDLDSYAGATRQAVEQYLGAPLDWGRALIQQTIGGGEHYAFRCDWPARQLQGDGPPGLDTRAAGRGFICTGTGYTEMGAGVRAMATPDCLPDIPAATRAVLGVPPPPPPRDAPPHTETPDTEHLFAALRHLDPGCSRGEWLRTGMALRHHYRDDPDAGMDVFDRWSAGEWWPGGTPINYVPEHIPGQWGSLRDTKDGRTVTVATLFYQAIQAGWRPPVTFDTAMAFGAAAAPTETFNALFERVQASGGDPRQAPGILDEIRTAGCNALQTALLAAELKNALKDAGIKDKAVSAHIDNMLSISTPGFSDAGMPGVYGKNDTDNASVFIDKNYPGGTLIKCDGEFFNYDGKIWRKLPLDSLKHQIAVDMSAARVSSSRVNSCIDLLSKLVPVRDGEINRHRADIIVFDNGTLHLPTNTLQRHDPEHYNTVMLPCAYDQAAEASQWLAFLHQIMDSDTERVALLQEWVGYLMINDYRHHKIMLLIGPKRCGKGTIGRVIQRLVGELNFTGGSLTSLARDSFIDSLRTKTALFIGDAAKRVPNAAINQVIERIKCISGNDAVDFDRKYLSGLSETLPTRITIAANSVPNLFDDSGALASRIMMLPLYQSFYGREDLNLLDKLLAELPGIACWALDGLRRLQQVGRFTVPAVSQWEYAQLQESYSPVLQFVTECCQIRLDVRCTSDELYACYRAWCVNQGENLMQRKTFVTSIRDALRERGVAYTKIDHTRGFHGLAPTATAPSNAVAFVPRVVT